MNDLNAVGNRGDFGFSTRPVGADGKLTHPAD